MSFINMMGNDVWSEEDIINRTESLLYGAFSREREQILNRKMVGFSLGRLIPTFEEQAELEQYEAAAYLAQQEGFAARADMELLRAVLDYERHVVRLSQPEVPADQIEVAGEDGEPVLTDNPDYQRDRDERAAARVAINDADSAVLELAATRAALRAPSEPVQAEPAEPDPVDPVEAS